MGGALNDSLTAWSLFSGVGGFDLGLERAGVRVTRQCEANAWRRHVLDTHWPGVPCTDDVQTLSVSNGDELPDILCGGFPCQDLSVAGRRAGLAGNRSGLFFEFARLAEECRLAERGGWVFLENVPGLFSSNGGRDFGVVLGTLADLGFAVAYRVLDSRFHGVPQRRRRIFLVGHPRADYARAVLLDPEGRGRDPEAGDAQGQEVAGTLGGGSGTRGWCDDLDRVTYGHEGGAVEVASLSGLGSGGPDDNDAQSGRLVATGLSVTAFHATQDPITAVEFTPALSKESSGVIGVVTDRAAETEVAFVSENQRAEVLETEYAHQLTTGGGKPGQGYPCVRTDSLVRRLTPRECERLQGFPDDWTAVDGLPTYAQAKDGSWRCKTGTPDSKRYAAMGDAVTVNVIEAIARRIVAVSEGLLCP